MKVVSESEFWIFVAQERAQALEMEKQLAKKEPQDILEWVDQELEKSLESKARFEKEGDRLNAEYWTGYADALSDVRKMLREVF